MTPDCDVWMAKPDHERLLAHLFPGDNDEHGAVLRCGVVQLGDRLRLVVRHVDLAVDGKDYGPGEYGHRALRTDFIHRNIMACRKERLAYLAVHNHGSDQEVAFSSVDLKSHVRGYPALRDIGRGVPVGALVFGYRSVAADVWLPEGPRASLREFRVIGSGISRFYSYRGQAKVAGAPEFDRQVRMFGALGQATLKKAKVAIVGLGGVGSLVSEYLARLGVGELVLIDPDRIEGSNLARVIGATVKDVNGRRLKTEIAARRAREAQPHIRITQVPRDVAEREVASMLVHCDMIFLAADSMRARFVANAIAHQYFVPVVQLGAKVLPGDKGVLVDAMAAVRQVRPGKGCLWCHELIDPGALAIESKTDEERKAQAYGTNEPNPSVITMNAVAAAHGVNDFLFDFLGLRDESVAQFDHFRFLSRKLQRVVAGRVDGCPECDRRFGMGDALPLPCVTRSAEAPPPSFLGRMFGAFKSLAFRKS
jgi:hypothetical protein